MPSTPAAESSNQSEQSSQSRLLSWGIEDVGLTLEAHALQVAPAGGPHNGVLVTNLESASELLHITPALLQSSDVHCSQKGCYNEYTRGELMSFIDWLEVFTGESRQKAREDTSEARRIRVSKLEHERGSVTKAAGALISPSAVPRDYSNTSNATQQAPHRRPRSDCNR